MSAVVRLLGLDFDNRVGLAAGHDRDGIRLEEAGSWGFGFVELGTVTPLPVAGHNAGAHALAERLRKRVRTTLKIGVNIGAQPGGDANEAWRDYVRVMRSIDRQADYLAINFTGDSARALLDPGNQVVLDAVLAAFSDARAQGTPPVLLKLPLAAALADDARIARQAIALAFDGIIAVREDATVGGISALARVLPESMVLVAAGGIVDAETATRCIAAGADLIQMHRAFDAGGPGLVRAITVALEQDVRRHLSPAGQARSTGCLLRQI